MTVTIRPYEQRDWDAICRIHDAGRITELTGSVSLDAYRPLVDVAEEEGLFGYDVRVAELEGAVVGFIAATDTEIGWLYVDPGLGRRGVGRALVDDALTRSTGRVELEVLDGNLGAQAFYRALGFEHERTTSGRLPGNESFTVTVHTMVRAAR